MAPDAKDGLGRWRGARPSRPGPSRARTITAKWLKGSLLASLLAVFAGALVYLAWQLIFRSKLDVEFVPLVIVDYEKPQVPPLPWADADRKAFQIAKLFQPKPDDESTETKLTTEVAKDKLNGLQHKKTKDAVVVYLAARALVDSSGAVQIVTAESDPYAPKTLLPFKDVVASLKACPAQKKLLVVDLMSAPPDPLDLEGTADGVADLLAKELVREDDPQKPLDPRLMVLLACSPGERALWSEPLGQSVFGHYVERAFADPDADTDQNRGLDVKELTSYLARNVDRWALQHRGVHQRPTLLGKAPQFVLGSINPRRAQLPRKDSRPAKDKEKNKSDEKEKEAAKEKAAEPSKDADQAKKADEKPAKEPAKDGAPPAESTEPVYPQWLTDAWDLRDKWFRSGDYQAAPRVFRRLEASLLRGARLAQRERTGGHSRPVDWPRARALGSNGSVSIGQAPPSAFSRPGPRVRRDRRSGPREWAQRALYSETAKARQSPV